MFLTFCHSIFVHRSPTNKNTRNMKIRKIILMAIKGNTELRRKLKKVLGVSEPTFYRLLTENDDDLTKAAALKVIREELNLTDAEILDESEVKETQDKA